MDLENLKSVRVKENDYYIKKNNSLKKFHLLLINLDNSREIIPEKHIFINNSVYSDGLMIYIYQSYKYLNIPIQIYIYRNNDLIKFLFPIKLDNITDIDIINDYLLYCFDRDIYNNSIEDLRLYINNMNVDNEKSIIYF